MGLEPTTVCLEGRDSSHWATPAYTSIFEAHAFYKKCLSCQNFLKKSLMTNERFSIFKALPKNIIVQPLLL